MTFNLLLPLALALADDQGAATASTSSTAQEANAADTLAALTPLLSTSELLSVAVGYVEMECGHVGDSVPIVRDALTSAGYQTGQGPADTFFGANLAAGVKRFQRTEGLDSTGALDQPTLVRLVLVTVDDDDGGEGVGSLEDRIFALLLKLVESKQGELSSRLDDEPCSEGKSSR